MALEHWLIFAAASAALLAIPGPTILMVVSYALGRGRKTALATVVGVGFGDLASMTASLLAIGALLMSSAEAFSILRWIGGAYLVYLGIRLWRGRITDGPLGDNDNLPEAKPLRVFAHGFKATAFNPKSLPFFLAFLPQFVDTASPFLPQMLIMEATFIGLALVNSLVYALVADKARGLIRKHHVHRAANRPAGTLLITSGAVTAGYRKIAA
ncbi:MAG: LysE family translocator [Allorhizobium sp.]